MLENFGLDEQDKLKKTLSEGFDHQWNKAFAKAGSALKKAKTSTDSIHAIRSAADRAAKVMKVEKPAFPDRSKLNSSQGG